MTDLTLTLADGRQLGYALFGPETGRPVLYFHGTPSSRLEPLIFSVYNSDLNELLQQQDIRLISIDRPGMGLSALHKERTVSSFAHDVHELLQHLQITSTEVVCWSGGGPFALSMAHAFPQIIKGAYIIAGFSSSFSNQEVYDKLGWNKMYFNNARRFPLLLEGALEIARHTTLHAPISQSLYELSDVDYEYLKDVDKTNELLRLTLKEACRAGSEGPIQEAALYFQPFDFLLSDIQVPVHFWWGTNDYTVTYVHAKEMERNLPQVQPHYKPGEGHVSIYVRYLPEVLQTLKAQTEQVVNRE